MISVLSSYLTIEQRGLKRNHVVRYCLYFSIVGVQLRIIMLVFTRVCVCVYMCARACGVCVSVYMYVCICVCVYVYL